MDYGFSRVRARKSGSFRLSVMVKKQTSYFVIFLSSFPVQQAIHHLAERANFLLHILQLSCTITAHPINYSFPSKSSFC